MSTRINAALAEMQGLVTALTQRTVNLAGDLAECGEALNAAQAELVEVKQKLADAEAKLPKSDGAENPPPANAAAAPA